MASYYNSTLAQLVGNSSAGDRAWNQAQAARSYSGLSSSSSGGKYTTRGGGGGQIVYNAGLVGPPRKAGEPYHVYTPVEIAQMRAQQSAPPPPPPPPAPPPAPDTFASNWNWTKENFKSQADFLRQGWAKGFIFKDSSRTEKPSKEELEVVLAEKRKELGIPDVEPVKPAQPTSTSTSLPKNINNIIPQIDLSMANLKGYDSKGEYQGYPSGVNPLFAEESARQKADRESMLSYKQAENLARGDSQAASALIDQFESPRIKYGKGYTGQTKKIWSPSNAYDVTKAVQQESALLGKMKAQESSYDKAFAEAQKAQEMAKTKTGVIQSGSVAQQVIGGGTGAGQEKAGVFKSIYGTGSLLPASWMQSKLDPTKVAQKISGLENRSGTEQLTVRGGDTTPVTLTYGRSEFKTPTLKKTGLGRYATIV